MPETFKVSVADIQNATNFGLYRLRSLFADAPPSIAAPVSDRGAAPRLYRLSDVLPILRGHRKWSADLEAALLLHLQTKDIQHA